MNNASAEKILNEILSCSIKIKDSAGKSVTVVNESAAIKISEKYYQTINDIYIQSLTADIWPYRYVRNRDTLSVQDQLKLAASCVAVIGCGGLGGDVLLMLSRIGVGSLKTVDPDIFDESNLNRQAFADSATIGMPKTAAAAMRIQSINPAVNFKAFQTSLTPSNAAQIFQGADVVVDSLDNFPDRQMLKQMTCQMNLPLVHGAVAGFEGEVMTFLPEEAENMDLLENAGDIETHRDVNAEWIIGVPSITPVFIASLQAMEVVKILLKRGNPFSCRMLYSDIELGEFNYFDFKT
jgi:molybdopterin/thiamine biosynthesis adenylyltransferase